MIKLSTMDKRTIAVNVNQIEKIENMPETVITLTNGKKLIVADDIDEVIEKAALYQSRLLKMSRISTDIDDEE